MNAPEPNDCLAATPLVDSEHPAVRAFAAQHAQGDFLADVAREPGTS